MTFEELRKSKKMSQGELAEMMNAIYCKLHPDATAPYNTGKVSYMERNPGSVTVEDLRVLQMAWGVSADELVGQTVPVLETTPVQSARGELDNVCAMWREELTRLQQDGDPILPGSEELLHRCADKPRIAFLGRPDAGKTTLVRSLLGESGKWLPTGWSPETSALCCIKHINDRPKWAGDSRVLVFTDVLPEERMLTGGELEALLWQDEQAHTVVKGGYDILRDYASHKGQFGDTAEVIFMFADADLLQNCDLLDLPGFSPEGVLGCYGGEEYDSRDSLLSVRATGLADAVVYMSIANSFCYGEDADMVRQMVTTLPVLESAQTALPPFCNIFVVASQAMAVSGGDTDELNRLLDAAVARLWPRIEQHDSMEQRQACLGRPCSAEDLRARFFTSEITLPDLSARFLEELQSFCRQYAQAQAAQTGRLYANWSAKQASYRVSKKLNPTTPNALVGAPTDRKARKAEAEASYKKTRAKIEALRDESLDKVEELYHKVIDAQHIRDLIEEKGYKKNKRDMGELSSDLNAELQSKLTRMLKSESETFSEEIDSMLAEWDTEFNGPGLDANVVRFDVQRVFAGGVAGAAVLGAFSVWAASMGNLGGYILVAKAVSALAAVGIHVGGTAAAISAVSAIGGPAMLAIGVAVGAGLGMIALLGGTWKKTIGGKIVKQYDEAGALEQLTASVAEYWDDTLTLFDECCQKVFAEWETPAQ